MSEYYNPYRSPRRFGPLLAAAAALALLAGMVWVLVGVTPMETIQYEDGRFYDGNVKNGIPHGDGRMVWPENDPLDRSVYEGQWENGLRHGIGTMAWADGSCYEGSWQEDLRHGSGIFTTADGQVYQLTYEMGLCSPEMDDKES